MKLANNFLIEYLKLIIKVLLLSIFGKIIRKIILKNINIFLL